MLSSMTIIFVAFVVVIVVVVAISGPGARYML